MTLVTPVTRLHAPDPALRRSWAEAVAEFDGIPSMHGSGLWSLPPGRPLDTTEAGCREVVALLLDAADPDAVRAEGHVACSYFWMVDDEEEVVGFLALRHELNAFLLDQGGHVGYSVRPSRRREGHAARALRAAVRLAGERGIDRLLVTCDHDNEASAATIRGGGGVLEDRRQDKLRYWIET